MHNQHTRGDVVHTPGGGVGQYVGTEPSGLEWYAYNSEDFPNMCVAFDERAKKRIAAPDTSNTMKLAAIGSVLAGTALFAWYCWPKDNAFGAKKAAGAPHGLHALAASLTPAQKAAVHAARAGGMSPVQALASVGISPAQLAAATR
jgi:hypothetical protein